MGPVNYTQESAFILSLPYQASKYTMPVSTITLPPAYSMPAPEINTPQSDNNGSDPHLRPRRQTSTIRRVIPTADANAKVVIVEEAKGVKTVNLSPFFVVDESEENEKEKARVVAKLAESWEASGTFLVKVSDEDKAILQNAVKVGHDFFSLLLTRNSRSTSCLYLWKIL